MGGVHGFKVWGCSGVGFRDLGAQGVGFRSSAVSGSKSSTF